MRVSAGKLYKTNSFVERINLYMYNVIKYIKTELEVAYIFFEIALI